MALSCRHGVLFVARGVGRHRLHRRRGREPLRGSGARRHAVWKFATGGPIDSSPAVDRGLVFFGSADGAVYALDAARGTLRWRFATRGERRFAARGIHGMEPRDQLMADPFDVFASSPAVALGTVFIGSGAGRIYALDERTGTQRWALRTGDVVHASPAVAGGIVYAGSWDRYLYALDARTGALRWKFPTGADPRLHNQVGIASSAAVAGGAVYVGCRDSFFYALDARTGRLRWKHDDKGSWIIASPAVANGTVYFTTSDQQRFFALDAATGRERFSVPYDAYAFSSPSLAGGRAYYGTFDGFVYAVDARDGTVRARFATDGSRRNRARNLDAHGALDMNAFYRSTTLAGVEAGLARIYAMGSIAGTPAIAGGVLYVGSTDGTLYALD